MSPEPVHVRQQHLHTLGQFSLALGEALKHSGPGFENLRQAVSVALSGECVQCGIRVSAEELLALSEPTGTGKADPRVGRLRQGYCARNGCDSYYYRLTFAHHPNIDWARLLTETESDHDKRARHAAAERAASRAARRAALRRLAGRAFVGVAFVVVLLVIRQWYLGGRIPLIREPENFQVDHFPSGHEPP